MPIKTVKNQGELAHCINDTFQNGHMFQRGYSYPVPMVLKDVHVSGYKFFENLPAKAMKLYEEWKKEKDELKSVNEANESEVIQLKRVVAELKAQNEKLIAKCEAQMAAQPKFKK